MEGEEHGAAFAIGSGCVSKFAVEFGCFEKTVVGFEEPRGEELGNGGSFVIREAEGEASGVENPANTPPCVAVSRMKFVPGDGSGMRPSG